MPTFEVTAPDGRRYRVNAPDGATQEQVMAFVQSNVKAGTGVAAPPRKSEKKAAEDARRFVGSTPNAVRAFTQGAGLGWSDELNAAAAYGIAGLNNLLKPVTGGAGYTAGEAYDAVMREEARQMGAFGRKRPVSNFALQLLGGVATGGAGTKAITSAPSFGQVVLRSGLIGGGYGAVAGAGAAQQGAANRLKGAATGAATGAAVGAAVPVAFRTAQKVAGGLRESGSRVAQTFGAQPGEAVVTPEATRKAQQVVASLAGGKSIEELAQDAALVAGKPITGAEILGRPAQTQLMALGRRSGATADQLEATLASRADDAGSRVVDDVAKALNLDPDFVETDFAMMVDKLRKRNPGLYEAAYNVPPPDSNRLTGLMQRPSVQKALRNAYNTAREEGVSPEALGIRLTDNMDDWASYFPDAQSPTPVSPASGAAVKRPTQGQSLMQFIAKGGGMVDDGGELRAMDGERWHIGKPFQRKVIGNADTADGWAMRAWEAGYFPELQDRPTPRQLYDAIADEMRGKPRFVREADARQARRFAEQEMADELAYRGGDLGDTPSPEQYVGRPEPRMDAEAVPLPTMQAWDYIKRGLDDVLEGYRDGTTRRLNLDTQGRAVTQTAAELRDELTRLNPAYGEALAKAGEPIRLEQAYRDIPGLMRPGITVQKFQDRIGRLTPAEREAALAGLVVDLQNKVNAGQLKSKTLATRGFRMKLEALTRDTKATKAIVDSLALEARLAAGQRMRPGTNSVTSEANEAMRELDRGTGFMADLQRRAEAGQGPVKSVTGAFADAVASPFAGFVRGVQAPHNMAVRDEVGRILLDPELTLEAIRAGRAAPAVVPGSASAGLAVPALSSERARAVNGPPPIGIVRDGYIYYPDGTIEPY